jgi:2-methylisocitrate lyase-like PEP mutase family enzyme
MGKIESLDRLRARRNGESPIRGGSFMGNGSALRRLLDGAELVMAPGAPDALTARLVEQAGFPAVYMTGFGATASTIGCPDVGLLTQTEMTTHARNMVRAVRIPVIADADTGYGGPANVQRTVKEYQQAGAAAIHLEDQAAPKRCGHMAGVKLVSVDEMLGRLGCALAARGEDDLLIIGRTDALAAGAGIEEAIRRACRYRDAGVDIVFVDAIKHIEDARAAGRAVDGPKMISVVEGTEAAGLLPAELKAMGFSLALYPLSTLFTATRAIQELLTELKQEGTTAGRVDRMASYADFSAVVRLDHFRGLDDRFGPGASPGA